MTGIFGILLCLEQPAQYLIEMIIAVGVAFVISFLLYKDQKPEMRAAAADGRSASAASETAAIESSETEDAAATAAEPVKDETLNSPVNGRIVPLSEVSDETFASEMLGTTVAVEPSDGRIAAPCDAEILNVFDTGHAVCLTTKSGGELLIHVGVDTVKMEGKGFTKKVADGDKVHAGDVLIEADLDAIREAGYPATTMVILTNADQFSKVEKAEPGEVGTGSRIMELSR